MKMIRSYAARAVLRVPMDDVKPTTTYSPQQVISGIMSRYDFSQAQNLAQGGAPINILGAPGPAVSMGIPIGFQMNFQPPIVLQNGTASINNRAIGIQQLVITPDLTTIIIGAETTEDADIILDDIISLMEGTYGFHDLAKRGDRVYGSSLIVEFDEAVEQYISVFEGIEKLITPAYKSAFNIKQEVKIERFAFACDPTELPAAKAQFVASFTIERRAGHPFDENRYFCGAPLKTSDHIALIEAIERVMKNGALAN
jgi:hypothetical protein